MSQHFTFSDHTQTEVTATSPTAKERGDQIDRRETEQDKWKDGIKNGCEVPTT
jgi:hypothetical protein